MNRTTAFSDFPFLFKIFEIPIMPGCSAGLACLYGFILGKTGLDWMDGMLMEWLGIG